MSDPVLVGRAKVGAAARYGTPEDVSAARAELAAAHAERAIRHALDGTPPITEEQRHRLAALLTGADR